MSDDETATAAADADATATAKDATETPPEEPLDEPPEDPPIDPEIVALKESIASLESDLKAKKYNLSDLQQKADKFSSAGYARQVALGVNNKRARGANESDSKSAARATVLQKFLPVLDSLDAVGAKYEDVAFAQTFDAGVRVEFDKALAALGVVEYVAESGQGLDAGRVVAVEEEHSEEVAKGNVIRALKSGLEISGNIVRPAEVVGSLGSESATEEAAPAEEGGEAAAEEEAPAENGSDAE